ncbi:MAG: insulinase family protein [Bacteroidales bacterium]|nr:insulinase family protein [Bacteroidales bacterium]
MKRLFISVILILASFALGAQGLKSFVLPNGLSVFVWEDPSQPAVYGEVAVRTGSVNDPAQYTGLAHYLEHVMFKGTTTIGALDWEKEKPVYEKIIEAYDRMADAPDQASKDAVSKEINALTVEAAQYGAYNEYSNLIESIGGTSLNAGTSYDYTVYYNKFPANQLSKWLMLACERFVNPVFRGFQMELETVYEEYNLYADRRDYQASRFLMEKIFAGTPYARDVIGEAEHLKNPRLSRLIKFYSDWYVPSNMAVILCGNIDTRTALRMVNATFGRLPAGTTPERPAMNPTPISGRMHYTSRCSSMPSVAMCYKGVPQGHPDELPLQLCMSLLSNDNQTGLLDRQVVAGYLMGAQASGISFRGIGRNLVYAVPFYDNNQRRYDSSRNVEKMVTKAVKQLAGGDIDLSVLESVKSAMSRDFDLAVETPEAVASYIRSIFIGEEDMQNFLDFHAKLKAVTPEDISRVAKTYLDDNFIVVYNEIGKPSHQQSIKKPDFEPITPPAGVSSAYAQNFKQMHVLPIERKYADWSKVEEKQINDYSKLYYTCSPDNDIFTLVLRYGANCRNFPKLRYAAELMNNAGILATLEAPQLKRQYAMLGTTLRVAADRDYLYVYLTGHESSLRDACILLTRTLMMPALDDKQLDNVKGMEISSRYMRRQDVNTLGSALREYICYGDESYYRKEVSDRDVYDMTISELTGNMVNASKYAADIFYTGSMSFDNAYDILSTSLPLVEGETKSDSPIVRPMKEYTENTVFFLPSTEASQSQIYFYINAGDDNPSENVSRKAFNSYIGGGFNGLIMQEIREKNAMAYTATGGVSTLRLPGGKSWFSGYVGTQNDKALGAIDLYLSLLGDMPERPGTIDNIRDYLLQSAFTEQPDVRELGMSVARWKLEGYSADPAETDVPLIENLSFDDILSYYNTRIKGRPVVIGIVGDPKQITVEALSKYGKVIKLHDRQLFNEEDKMF